MALREMAAQKGPEQLPMVRQVINISDVFAVLPPTSARRDLMPDVINVSDVFKVLPPFFGSSCA